MSPALAGRFLTTRPPGKPWTLSFNVHIFYLTLCIYFRIISSVFFPPISLILSLAVFSFLFNLPIEFNMSILYTINL